MGALLAAGVAGLLYLGVVSRGLTGPVRLLKVVPALALAAGLARPHPALALAFACYALGDYFLLDKGRRFLPGLGAFLVGHLVFVVAVAAAPSPMLLLPGLAVAAGMCGALWRGLHGRLRVAVPVYALALVALLVAAEALGPLAVAGAAVFLVSDALLALQRFRGWKLGGDPAVMITYYAALGLLAAPALRPAGP